MKILFSFLILAMSAIGYSAEDQKVVVRSFLEKQEATIGESVILNIAVLGTGGWAKFDTTPELQIDGAYILTDNNQRIRLTETIDGLDYNGQQYQFRIFPQRGGKINLQTQKISVVVKSWGFKSTKTVFKKDLPSVSFMCKVPEEARGIRSLVSTKKMTVEQEWQGAEGAELFPGDAIKRFIKLEAEDVPGMAFEPLRFPKIDGLGIYAGEAELTALSESNNIGSRSEVVTYVVEESGNYDLPELVFNWWNTKEKKLEKIVLPGVSFKVISHEKKQPESQSQAINTKAILIIIASLIILLFLLRRYLIPFLKRTRAAYEHSEKAAFADVLQKAKQGNAKELSQALFIWLSRLEGLAKPARLDDFLLSVSDAKEKKAFEDFMRNYLDAKAPWNEALLLSLIKKSRKEHFRKEKLRKRVDKLLPKLNPEI